MSQQKAAEVSPGRRGGGRAARRGRRPSRGRRWRGNRPGPGPPARPTARRTAAAGRPRRPPPPLIHGRTGRAGPRWLLVQLAKRSGYIRPELLPFAALGFGRHCLDLVVADPDQGVVRSPLVQGLTRGEALRRRAAVGNLPPKPQVGPQPFQGLPAPPGTHAEPRSSGFFT